MVPQEPHEFDARLRLRAGGHLEKVRFRMSEPGGISRRRLTPTISVDAYRNLRDSHAAISPAP